MSERRILHVAQPVDAGVAAVVLALASHQSSSHGQQVAVACPPAGALPDELRWAGVDVLAWPATRGPGRALAQEYRALRDVVRLFDPHLVHLHSSKAGLVGRLVLRGRRATVFQPHAWSFHAARGPISAAAKSWERQAVRWSDRIIAVSAVERNALITDPADARIVVVHNGVDIVRFAPVSDTTSAEQRVALGLRHDALLVVCIGRVCHQKGQDLLLDAWPNVRLACPGAQLVVVGEGPDRARLDARGVEGVRFFGATADVRSWFGAAVVVVAPSRWEGQSLALLEAMACGAAIVATDVSGVREALGDDAGAIVPVNDSVALAGAVAGALTDRSWRTRVAGAARARAERLFTVASTLDAVDALYEEVMSERAS